MKYFGSEMYEIQGISAGAETAIESEKYSCSLQLRLGWMSRP
jgi:hypothetical protein